MIMMEMMMMMMTMKRGRLETKEGGEGDDMEKNEKVGKDDGLGDDVEEFVSPWQGMGTGFSSCGPQGTCEKY